jgi:hypothetical protein
VTTLSLALLLASGESKKSGPIGLAVILALCVVCYFLFKSMSRHLRKVREEFPDGPGSTPAAEPGDPPAAADVEPPPAPSEPEP